MGRTVREGKREGLRFASRRLQSKGREKRV